MDVNRTIFARTAGKGTPSSREILARIGSSVISGMRRKVASRGGQVRGPSPRARPASRFPRSRKTNRRKDSSRPARPSPRIHRLPRASFRGWGADENRNGARQPAAAMNGILGASLDLQVAQCGRNHEIFERRRRKSFIQACPSRLCRRTWRGQLSGRR